MHFIQLLSSYRKIASSTAAISMAVSTMIPSPVYAGSDGTDSKAPIQPVAAESVTGAELYAINCNRCHEERFPKEFTATEWTTLMLHMRVRANLTAAESKKILKYLQGQAGN
jgi:mono/diheme cytochrome c family protein